MNKGRIRAPNRVVQFYPEIYPEIYPWNWKKKGPILMFREFGPTLPHWHPGAPWQSLVKRRRDSTSRVTVPPSASPLRALGKYAIHPLGLSPSRSLGPSRSRPTVPGPSPSRSLSLRRPACHHRGVKVPPRRSPGPEKLQGGWQVTVGGGIRVTQDGREVRSKMCNISK